MRGLFLAFIASVASYEIEIDPMKHHIQSLQPKVFDTVIGKFRSNAVHAVWFYTSNADDSEFLEIWNSVANKLKGISRIGSVNCNVHKAFCDSYKVTTTPHVEIFPPLPMSSYKYAGDLTAAGENKLYKHITTKIPSFVSMQTAETIDSFVTTDPTKPKVLLFSDKDKVPMIFKALSSELVLHRTTRFGFVKKSEESVCKKYKVKKFPTFVMVRGAKAELVETYKGKMEFPEIQHWVNLHSESGMGDTLAGGKEEERAEEARPWLAQEIPELTQPSHKDVCFRGEGLCVIYLTQAKLQDQEESMLRDLKDRYTSQLSGRGTTFKWMWMDMAVETGFKDLFKPANLPSVVVFNAHKRLRFTSLGIDTPVTQNDIVNLIDKILGGDARFKMVKGHKLPKWAERKAADGKAKEEL